MATDTSGTASEELEEVMVTGTRLETTGFNAPTPVTVIGQDVILQRAPTDANDIVKEIPQLRSAYGAGNTGPSQTSSAAQQYVNLYALTAGRTLTLIDGHRKTPDAITGQVDVNTIPTFLIDRVELVTGGASAAYGSDAMAGVANFVLKDRLDGFYGAAGYGQAEHGSDRQVSTTSLGFGSDLFGNRARFLVGAEVSRDTGIDDWYQRDFGQKEPGLFATGNPVVGGGGTRAGQPAAVWVNNYQLAANTPGGIINSCVPATANCSGLAGTAFNSSGTAYSFPYGTRVGSFMYGSMANYGDNPDSFMTLSAPYKRWTGVAKFTYDITDSLQLRLEYGYSGTSAEEVANISNTTVSVPASNPFLPASVSGAMAAAGVSAITVGRTNTDLGVIAASQLNRSQRALIELSGELPGTWKWDAYYAPSKSTQEGTTSGLRTSDIISAFSATSATQCGTLSAAQLASTGAASPGCVPFDIFGVGQASPAAYAYLHQYTQRFKMNSEQQMSELSVHGEAFSNWAGPVPVAAGIDYRKDEQARIPRGDSLLFPNGGFVAGNYVGFSAERDVREAYVETEFPLLSDLPFVKSLGLNGAYRYMDYSDQGGYNAWKLGMTWEINDEYRLRFTRSHDIRSPTLLQEYGVGTISQQQVLNPITNTTNTVNYRNPAPNPDLGAETSFTTTAGIVMQPDWASGLRLSVDYFAIDISDVITTLLAQPLVTGCLQQNIAWQCEQLTFSGNTITSIQSKGFNLNGLYVNGFNIEGAYRLPGEVLGGDLTLRTAGTNITHYRQTDKLSNTVQEQATNAAPRWTANFIATWHRGPVTSSAEVMFHSPLKYSVTSFGPDDSRYWATVTSPNCPGGSAAVPTQCANYLVSSSSISRNIFPSATYLNLSLQYDFDFMQFRQMQAYVKVDNALDKDVPAYAAYAFFGQSFYDFIGRNYKAGVRVSF